MIKNKNLLQLRLMENYGKLSLNYFYPEIISRFTTTYKGLILLYQECLEQRDVDAINLLISIYDINEIMSFDNKYNTEISLNKEMTKCEHNSYRLRCERRKAGKSKVAGGRCYRNWFKKDNNGEYYFDARSCAYDMTKEQIQTLFETLDNPPEIDYIKLLPTELSDVFYKHPERDRLLLFYLKYMCNQKFPVEDWEMLKNGEYKIV